MNFSAILISIALRAADTSREDHAHATLSIEVAIVFAVMALEALLNELAFLQVQRREDVSTVVYTAVDKGSQGFNRFQAVLEYFFGRGLSDGRHPANDFKLLLQIRNGFVHYRFERPPDSALRQLQQRGLFGQGWDNPALAWPMYVLPPLAVWACRTACDTAHEIASILDSAGESDEAALIRRNFDSSGLDRGAPQTSVTQ